jgi:hypothetical protein
MVSLLHEGLIQLVRDHPKLADTLLTELLGVPVPPFTKVRLDDTALPKMVPVPYFADAVALFSAGDKLVFGAIIEHQLQRDDRKLFTWPLYALAARARHQCPFVVIVPTPDPETARWAAQPIDLGDGQFYRVRVIGPDGVPIVTDAEHAIRDPYLAMLSAIAHGKGDQEIALAIAKATVAGIRRLPREDQWLLYLLIIWNSLGEPARKAFEMLPEVQPFLSESQRRFFTEVEAKGKAEGKAEGNAEGMAKAVLKILAKRGISLTEDQGQRILACVDLGTLDRWLDRALTATTADELFE